MTKKRYTVLEWQAEARRRFGENSMEWAFVCPICKHVARVSDWKAAGAPENAVAFSCVGRWSKDPKIAFPSGSKAFLRANEARPGPCNYAGGGLFQLNPVEVVTFDESVHFMFDFAPESIGYRKKGRGRRRKAAVSAEAAGGADDANPG